VSTGNITLPDEMLPQLKELARAENKTADAIATEAVKQHLIRRLWDRTQREATKRRGNMTGAGVDEVVNLAIQSFRKESRSS
jgi:predicted transcriptional regulator